MLEITNLKIPIARIKTPEQECAARERELARQLKVAPDELTHIELRRRAIDARKRTKIQLVYTLRFELTGGRVAEDALCAQVASRTTTFQLRRANEAPTQLPAHVLAHPSARPVVVGAGCAGLFCALILAEAGAEPLLIERGQAAGLRSAAIEIFNATGALDPENNIQFGLGGAGTFSDGKLATGTKSPYHRFIREAFVAAGASPSVLYDAHPHVGSDVLPQVVTKIAQRIEELGGEVRFGCRMDDISLTAGRISSITTANHDGQGITHEEQLAASALVLACGHSARDVFELLQARGVALERKPFAMGVRIEHLQASINRALYGTEAENPLLGAAPYKLVAHLGARSAYSFCMCPGGYVVAAASEPEGVVTNGMSLAARNGTNANAGLLCAVEPSDLAGGDPLAGIALQRQCEQAAFAAGGGAFRAPAQLVGDFLAGQPSSGAGDVSPTYPRGVSWGSLDSCLPDFILETLRAAIPVLDHKLAGFAAPDAVLTGVETRSSSPVRVVRGSDGQSVSTPGLFPAGEGAGYAGGIMSAAADGIRAAEAVLATLGA